MLRFRYRVNDGYLCPICNEPVNLETAKTDGKGRAVHEECYCDKISKKISGKTPPKPPQNNFPFSST